MKREFPDFCVSQQAIISRHPHIYEIYFCLVSVDSSSDLESLAVNLSFCGLQWYWRAREAFHIPGAFIERESKDGIVTSLNGFRLLRPIPGLVPEISSDWLELTPRILGASVNSPESRTWLKDCVRFFGPDRVVISSDSDFPCSLRDAVALFSFLTGVSFSSANSAFKSNGRRLVEEIG